MQAYQHGPLCGGKSRRPFLLFPSQDLKLPLGGNGSIIKEKWREGESWSVLSDSLWPHGLYRGLNSPVQNTGVGNWVSIPFSRGSSQPRGQTQVFHIAGRFFTSWAKGKPENAGVGSPAFHSRSSWPRNWTGVSCIAGRFCNELSGKPWVYNIDIQVKVTQES